jgi:autotransporter strand-loop-strand O-heptosyltransferase
MSVAAIPVDEPAQRRPPDTATPGPAAPAPASATAPRVLRQPISGVAELPTQEGPRGIRFDFNDGCRVLLPEAEHPWRVRLSDLDSGVILFDAESKAGQVNSTRRYYIRFRLEIWQRDELVFAHDYSAANREVLVRFPVDTVGDPIGWFTYALKFRKSHGCKLTCMMSGKIIALLRNSYPDVTFATEQEIKPERFYAAYSIAVFYKKGVVYDYKNGVPCDFRRVGLHRAAGYILGVDPAEEPPRIALADDSPPIAEPYVCIATQSTMQAKYWNNPTGWDEIVRFLKETGYRVVCIDLRTTHGKDLVWNHMPPGAEDQTGDRPLIERARWLKYADFFVGLSSGLSWLAWAMRTPVVMISGVTHPINEFETPYRVINYHACNSCWNDPLSQFDRNDFMSCPRHKDTPRQFECSRLITAEQVKHAIRCIPGFGLNRRGRAAGMPIIVEQFLKALKRTDAAPPRELFAKTLEFTERLPPRHLARYQRRLLARMLWHAHDKLPFYRDRLGDLFTADGKIDLSRWNTVPVLQRPEITAQGRGLRVANLSADYGRIAEAQTSGSTGVPLKIATNDMVAYAASAMLTRAARRLGVDPSRPLARIGHFRTEEVPPYPEGSVSKGWSYAHPDAPLYQLKLSTPVDQQLEWLARRRAPYLLALPSAALNVAYSITPEQGRALGIEVVFLIGETVPEGARELIAERFGARVLAVYGCREIGQVAAECEAGNYHAASETALVEIVDSEGREVAPGESGRVVATGFFNYVMPFIRYDLGDVAVAGTGPCSCGRTLPVIARIAGRTRNMFEFRDGTRLWPRAPMIWPMRAFVPYRRYQLIQLDHETIEFRYEPDGSGREPDLAALNACARDLIHPSVSMRLVEVDSLSVGPGGKLEEFISKLPAPNGPR